MGEMFLKHSQTVLSICMVLIFAALPAVAERLEPRDGDVAEIVDTQGDEELRPVGQTDWRKAQVEQDLIVGDLLQTGSYGGLGLAFIDRTQIRLHANTRMEIADPGASGERVINLEAGSLWSRASAPNRDVIVETPTATAAIRGTDWYIEVADDGTSRLQVLDGGVQFSNPFGVVTVRAGSAAIARPGQAPIIELVADPSDRPRWALTPRADWVHVLPIAAIVPEISDPALQEGFGLLTAGDVSGAKRAVAFVGPSQAAGRGVLAAILAISERRFDAARDALPLGEVQPGTAFSRLTLMLDAGLDIETGDFDGAVSGLKLYEDQHGYDPSLAGMLAYLELYGGRYQAARDLIAPYLDGEVELGLLILAAQTCALQDDMACFDALTQRAVREASDNPLPYYWRTVFLSMAGGTDEDALLTELRRSLDLNPQFLNALVFTGAIEALSGRPQEALDAYQRALELNPREPVAIAGQAYAHILMDRLDLAGESLATVPETEVNQPDILTAEAVIALMEGRPEDAANLTGKVIAANPARPGAATTDAIANFHLERFTVGLDVIDNAVRLDPNEPFTALVGSYMAQDQYAAGLGIDYALKAWDAKARNEDAGLVGLPGSQTGRLDIGSAFRNVGFTSQGEHYTSLAYSIFDANSAFGQSQTLPDPLARQSALSLGLLLDPLSVTGPNRNAMFYREAAHRATLEAGIGVADDGSTDFDALGAVTGLVRAGGHPWAYGAALSVKAARPDVDNGDADNVLFTFRLGHERNAEHGFLLRTTLNARDAHLPGSFNDLDADDTQDGLDLVFDVGYTQTLAWNDRRMFRVTAGISEGMFENPSAFGTTVKGLDYAVARAFGLPAAQDFAARGLFDTSLNDPGEFLLAVNPPAGLPTTAQLGQSLLNLQDDADDPVTRIDTDAQLLSLQTRRVVALGPTEFSWGVEFGERDIETETTEFASQLIAPGALVDFDGDPDVFGFGVSLPVETLSQIENRRQAYTAYASAKYDRGPWTLEGGIYPTYTTRRFENTLTNDVRDSDDFLFAPRLGVGWTGDGVRARLALQQSTQPTGVDTIAPLGTLFLVPNRSLGYTAETIDSAVLRLGLDVSPRVFVDLNLEYQDLEEASAGAPGRRAQIPLFTVTDARVSRGEATLEARLTDRASVMANVALAAAEISGDGLFDGNDLPIVPELIAGLGGSWIDPRMFRIDVGLTYVGERFADVGNLVELDAAWLGTLAVQTEARDKRWLLGADLGVVSSDDNPREIGQPAQEWRAGVRLARRW